MDVVDGFSGRGHTTAGFTRAGGRAGLSHRLLRRPHTRRSRLAPAEGLLETDETARAGLGAAPYSIGPRVVGSPRLHRRRYPADAKPARRLPLAVSHFVDRRALPGPGLSPFRRLMIVRACRLRARRREVFRSQAYGPVPRPVGVPLPVTRPVTVAETELCVHPSRGVARGDQEQHEKQDEYVIHTWTNARPIVQVSRSVRPRSDAVGRRSCAARGGSRPCGSRAS